MSDPVLGWDEVIRFGTVAVVVWSAAWFLFRQQISIKDLLYRKVDELKVLFMDKLEYHERHDDSRFDNLNKSLIELRINQARQGNKFSKYMENGNGHSIRN